MKTNIVLVKYTAVTIIKRNDCLLLHSDISKERAKTQINPFEVGYHRLHEIYLLYVYIINPGSENSI